MHLDKTLLLEALLTLRIESCPTTRHEGVWGERSIAPTHSRPLHCMGVSGQRHASAVL
jgi:hypothetical protein